MKREDRLNSLFVLLLIAVVIPSHDVQAQQSEYDKFRQQKENEFKQFQQGIDSSYSIFKQGIDEQWRQFLESKWVEYQKFEGIEPKKDPKPVTFPRYNNEKIEPRSGGKVDSDTISQSSSPTPLDYGVPDTGTTVPVNFDFYGTTVLVNVDPKFKLDGVISRPVNADQSVAAKFWAAASKVSYVPVLNQLQEYEYKFNLNDWGYLRLVMSFSKAVSGGDAQMEKLYTWFILLNSKYHTLLMTTGAKFSIGLAVSHTVYGTSYYMNGNRRYYALEDMLGGGEKESRSPLGAKGEYPGASKEFDFTFWRPLNLPVRSATREVAFSFKSRNYKAAIAYNLNEIELLKDLPTCDFSVHANSQMSTLTKQSLLDAINSWPETTDLGEDAALLLSMTQNSFKYKSDQEQFNREKWMVGPEILYYPFSDCDDRTIFFSRLVTEFTEFDVIAVEYPSHMATAVNFGGLIAGEHLFKGEQEYVVCDPTYTNAPIGKAMSRFSGVPPKKVYTVKSRQAAITRVEVKNDVEYFPVAQSSRKGNNVTVLQSLEKPDQFIVDLTTADGKNMLLRKIVIPSDRKGTSTRITFDPAGQDSDVQFLNELESFDPVPRMLSKGILEVILETGKDYHDKFNPLTEETLVKYLNEVSGSLAASTAGKETAALVAFLTILNGKQVNLDVSKFLERLGGAKSVLYKKHPDVFALLKDIKTISCKNNVFKLELHGQKAMTIDKLKIQPNARFRLVSYESSNTKLEMIDGFTVGKAFVWFDLNSIRLLADKGELVFDYGSDGSKSSMLLKEMLE